MVGIVLKYIIAQIKVAKMNNDTLLFMDEASGSLTIDKSKSWKILIVDDEESVHTITKLALKNLIYNNYAVEFLSAHSAKKAKELINEHSDIAIVLLDVVMEEKDSGLKVAQYIRKELYNDTVRIIIRTGQPGSAPERYVIDTYDINDYKEKTELTTDRLYTTIRTALAQYQQISELSHKQNMLYSQMIHDPLTNLYNRYQLNIELQKHQKKSLVMLNIDSFGMLNDAYGFTFGDKVLKAFVTILENNFESLQLYRLDADIFTVLFVGEHNNEQNVKSTLDQLTAFLAHHTLHIDEIDIRINLTIGAVINEEKNLIQKADISVREARSISRNRIQFYSNELTIIKRMDSNTKWSRIILEALENDSILAYFQPIIDNKTGKIFKYEALVRLEYQGTIYSPAEFLETARYAGLLTNITKRMLEKACSCFSGTDYYFSVNITDHDLKDSELIDYIKHMLQKYQINPNKLIFELLEQTSVAQIPEAKQQLENIQKLGCQISIDDFGVECSNFAQLFNYQLESIKIDGSFIKNVHDSEHCELIVESILFFAKRLGIKTIAEYVHSKEVYDKIVELGVDYSQGYYFGKPEPTIQ